MSEQQGASTWRTGETNARGNGGGRGRGKPLRGFSSSKRGAAGEGTEGKKKQTSKVSQAQPQKKVLPNLPEPFHNMEYIKDYYYAELSSIKFKKEWLINPKNPVSAYASQSLGMNTKYEAEEGYVGGRRESSVRARVVVDEEHDVVGQGDAKTKKEAELLAALDALLQLIKLDLLGKKKSSNKAAAKKNPEPSKSGGSGTTTPKIKEDDTTLLSDGSVVTAEKAREFMTFYCNNFRYGKPDVTLKSSATGAGWDAEMRVGGAKIGMGGGQRKKTATTNVYLDAVAYLESQDPKLWSTFRSKQRGGGDTIVVAPVVFSISEQLDDDITRVTDITRGTFLYANRPRLAGRIQAGEAADASGRATPTKARPNGHGNYIASELFLTQKSKEMLEKLEEYLVDPQTSKIRSQRFHLPVQQKALDVLVKVELNQVCVVMAATGSGKTTQLPQLILDDYIMQNQGAKCNIIVTQPRRIAAISVAQRVAKERGESIGQSVGYSVRFDQNPPRKHGSINYCTTGHFLRRLQASLTEDDQDGYLDNISHIVIDEVHERDIETDLLLIILRRIMADRKKSNKSEFKVILMSATIDPTLFCEYFANPITKLPAPVVEVPGRSFAVEKHFLEETLQRLQSLQLPLHAGGWVWEEKSVCQYLERELSLGATNGRPKNRGDELEDDQVQDTSIDTLDLPYPLIALMVADIIMDSDDGHLLVFLPGWEEIKTVRMILENTQEKPLLGLNFNNYDRFEIHVLHSSIPVEEQQAIFEPVRHRGIRRIILATNIAETSVTIPDVVYVIDSGKSKETHYNPERHLQSLVSAWVGTSNVNQRAGRAGRHREGHAYSLLTRARYNMLKPSSMVAMKRENLSNIVMNIKAMNISGTDVEELLQEAIEAPAQERVHSAVDTLISLGALDSKKELTSLGQVLARMPTDAPIAKMCLYGAFFRCLDSTLTLAAILTERSPWIMAEAIRTESIQVKNSWSNQQFRSDALTTLRAFKTFEEMTKRGSSYHEIGRFCSNNFLHRGAMQTILKVKEQLFETLRSEGILNAVLNNKVKSNRLHISMPELNVNSTSLPLLTALLAMASTPKFAIKVKEKTFRTSQDKTCFMETSSVNHHSATGKEQPFVGEKFLYAYQAKTTSSTEVKSPPMLRGTTLLDPLTFMLFGANKLAPSDDGGMICDDWLPIKGDFGALDDVERLKSILDICMLRVFEAIENATSAAGTLKKLSDIEGKEFENLTMSTVRILEAYTDERYEDVIQSTTHTQHDPHSIGLLNKR